MSDSSYSSRPDKNNPNPIDLSRVFEVKTQTPPAPKGTAARLKGISVPTLLVCLVLCIATVLVSVLVSAATYTWIRAKGVTQVNQKTVIYQNVTQSVGDASGLPVQAQVATVQRCVQSTVEILAADTQEMYEQGKYGFGSGKFTMEEEHRIATGKLNLRDNDRAPYPINQELRNPNYVKTFRDQLAEKANLRILMAGRRELVLKTFAIKESVSELADKALGLLVKEQQQKEAAKPVKDAQLSKNEQLEQNQQKEIQSTLIS